jgi:hypothetical protein
MQASVGDQIVVESPQVGGRVRRGRIIEVRGRDGAPPYVVEWEGEPDGIFFPGPDAKILRSDTG